MKYLYVYRIESVKEYYLFSNLYLDTLKISQSIDQITVLSTFL